MTDNKPRRRRRQRPEIDHSVPSPCVAVCAYDGSGLCKGCLRNSDEIREWMIMSAEQKLAVLEQIELRKSQRGPVDDHTTDHNQNG